MSDGPVQPATEDDEGPMTVKELMDLLAEFHPEATVVLQKDAEGNGYSPLAGAEAGVYVPDSTWSGDFYGGDDAEEYGGDPDATDAVVLWPTN